MANVQKQFEEYHDKIRIDFDMSQPLRDKRDIIVKRIKKYLADKELPSFEKLDQGSYAYGTGIKPIAKLQYDIDVALRFEISSTKYSAVTVRGWVHDAVQGHTEDVDDRGPCTRVTYAEKDYHVDLVSYAWQKSNGTETFQLAHKTTGWRPANPPGILAYVAGIRKPFLNITDDAATKTDQFRRAVRSLKRWNDEAIPTESDDKPTGLAFVLLCAQHLKVTLSADGKPDDLRALLNVASAAAQTVGRIVLKKPTPEYDDVMAKLSNKAMDELKSRFAELAKVLEKAGKEPDHVVACKLLRKVFGADFPVPVAEETAKKTAAPAIITSSSSA